MVGILAALAVDSWWDGRQDEARARAYVRQLAVDVDANGHAIDDVKARHAEAIQATIRLSTAFDRDAPLPSCEELSNLMLTALSWFSLELRTGTYHALLTTGHIALIDDDDVRAEIIKYAGIVDSAMIALALIQEEQWITPKPFRQRVEFAWRLFDPREPGAPPPWAGCNFEPLRQDPEIREALFSNHLLHRNKLSYLDDLSKANADLRERLRSEMNGWK